MASMKQVNYDAIRVALVKSKVRTFLKLAARTRINRTRLSLIANGWVRPTEREKATIARVLHEPVTALFPEPSEGPVRAECRQ